MGESADRAQRGIQSVEVGGQLLLALVHHGGPMALKDLARESGMTAAKAHPYLVSFGRLGLIEQDAASGRYFLGPLALQLGLISLQQANPVQVATPLIADLAQQIGHTVAIAVWGSRGATIVRLEESPAAVHVNMRHGTVFSVTDTASGRLFAAYLDAKVVKEMLEDERRRERSGGSGFAAEPAHGSTASGRPTATAKSAAPPGFAGTRASSTPPGTPPRHPLPTWKEFEPMLDEVRRQGMSRSRGEVVAGVGAMAAPVFDHTGAIVLSITAIGPDGTFDTAWDGALAKALRACAQACSQKLGATGGLRKISP